MVEQEQQMVARTRRAAERVDVDLESIRTHSRARTPPQRDISSPRWLASSPRPASADSADSSARLDDGSSSTPTSNYKYNLLVLLNLLNYKFS